MPEWNRPAGRTSDTAIQRALHAILVDLGFDVEDEVAVGTYSLDCYVRELHVGFEADGPLHLGRAQRRHDEDRDTWIHVHAGIPVMRVSGPSLRDQDATRERIIDFLEDFRFTAEERRGVAHVGV